MLIHANIFSLISYSANYTVMIVVIRDSSDSNTLFYDLMLAVVESERTLYRKHGIPRYQLVPLVLSPGAISSLQNSSSTSSTVSIRLK